MNCSFFGSYSKQTFLDLFALNVRSHHKILHVYEIMDRTIVSTTYVNLTTYGVQTDLKRGFQRSKSSSYLVGLLLDDHIKTDTRLCGDILVVSMLETHDNHSLSYCLEKNKEFMELHIAADDISLRVGRKQRVYVDEFRSVSKTPVSGFQELSTPEPLRLNIRNITKD